MIGRIFDIQRFSVHDGPGIRTTVFLKGCPLRCAWCHNPEGLAPEPQISFVAAKCIACADCVRVCQDHGHRIERVAPAHAALSHVLDRSQCRSCGRCADVCDAGALEMVGRDVSTDEVLREVLADRAFYGPSGGGLTLSGGEPLLQADFAADLFAGAKAARIHCALETCGFAPWQQFQRLLGLVDLFLYDFKETDPERHLEFTGVPNRVILENLRALYAQGAAIALRCPIVPGYNDREEHLAGIAALAHEMPNLAWIELLPYHPLGQAKLDRLGMPPASSHVASDDSTVQRWTTWLEARGVRVGKCRSWQ